MKGRQRQQQVPFGMTTKKTTATLKAKANADPPFDFAQGRLFGDDNKKNNSNGKDEEQIQGSFAALRMTALSNKMTALLS
jgi:hypothetical protein